MSDQVKEKPVEEAAVNTRAPRNSRPAAAADSEFEEKVVCTNRNTKVVKGGKNMSFSALVVVGNRNGKVGMGLGKANDVSDAVRKGGEQARRNMVTVPMFGSTVTHFIEAYFRGSRVVLRPASTGTGVIAGGGMRAVLELAGVKDVLAKSLGSKNSVNVVKATFEAISKLRTRSEVLQKRDRHSL